MADLSVKFAGIEFKNSIWLGSGSPTTNFEGMKLGIDAGAGAVVAKSFTNGEEPKRQTLHLTKNCYLDENWRPVHGRKITKFYTQYSRVGTPPVSEDEWLEELNQAHKYASKSDAVVIGSIFGVRDLNEMGRLAKKMEQIGLKMLHLNLGAPHPEEMKTQGALLKASQDCAISTKAVTDSVSVPVAVKLSPQLPDLLAAAKACKEAGAAAIDCVNRFMGFAIDIYTGKPYISGWAGISGPWLLPISLRWVAKIHQDDPAFPILGAGGVYDWEDIVQFYMGGARAVGVCSSVMAKGYSVITEGIDGLNRFLDRRGYRSVRDIIGMATAQAHTYAEMYTLPGYKEKAKINMDLCIDCAGCLDACARGAGGIKTAISKVDKNYVVDEEICNGCRNCKVSCPIEDCIVMKQA